MRPKVTAQSLAMTLVAGDERFAPLANALRNVCVYAVFPDTLREPQKPDTVRPMKQHGENWTTILQGMTANGAAGELKAGLAKLTGDITDFRVRQLGGYLNAEFLHATERKRTKDRQKWFESAQESDGTLRVAGIITALLQEPPLTLIGIEEPELTVHVGAIPLLYDYLKQAALRGQVLLTTHCVELLERLDIDDIRVVERRNGVTTVAPVRHDQRDAIKKRLMTIGDVVSMEGLQQELPWMISPSGRRRWRRAYLVVEGHGDGQAASNLVIRLAKDFGLARTSLGRPDTRAKSASGARSSKSRRTCAAQR